MLPILERLLTRHLLFSVLCACSLVAVLSEAKELRDRTVTLVPRASALPPGCETHVVEQATEAVAPCGSPLSISAQPAWGWIETPTSMTPFRTDISGGGDIAVSGLVPAGIVTFSPGHKLGAGERIRLISLVPPHEGPSLRSLFVRDITSLDARPRMPAGRAVALLIDSKSRCVAVSPPIVINLGMETSVWPASPANAVVVAWLSRPRVTEREEQDRVTIRAVDETGPHEPDAIVNSADAVFAVWYDLDGKSVRLLVDSEELRIERDTVDTARGSVTMTEKPLQLLPALTVAIGSLPSEAASVASPMTLTLAQVKEEQDVIRKIIVEPGKSYTIESLPAALLTLDLRIGNFLLQKRVDLTSGIDATSRIPLEPLLVSGTVYYGDTPTRAVVRFQQKGEPLSVETDDRGTYEVTLWQPHRYVVETVLARNPTQAPFSQLVQINDSTTLDIRIPENALRARIFDTADGKPLEHAEILIHNRWSDELGPHAMVATVLANSEITALPPQRIGTSEVRVRAAGYADGGPITVNVDGSVRDRLIEIPMTRSTETSDLVIQLDGLAPAVGAEVAAWSGDQLLWRGTADEVGRLAVPESIAQTRIVIRHPSGASVVAVLGMSTGAQTISLAPAAPPLAVKVVHKDGTPVGPAAAKLSLWLVGGVRLSGPEAGFATWSFGATAPDGTLVARGLLAKRLRLFATRKASAAQIQSGTFDGLATSVPYPWPTVAIVPLVDE